MQQQMKDCRLKLELYAVSQIFHHYASHEVSTTVLLKKNRSSDKWCRVAGMMFLDVSEEHTVFIFSIRGVLPFCTPWVLLMKTTFFRYVGTNQSSGITSHNRNRRIFSPPLHWCKQSPLWSGNFKTVSGQKDTVRYQPYWTYCFVTKIYVIFRNRNLFI